MRPVPTTEPAAGDRALPVIDAGPSEYDDVLGVYTIFLDIPRAETVYVRLVVESWEDFAVPRTVERFTSGDPGRSLVVMLTVPDFIEPAARGLARLCAEVGGFQVKSRSDLRESLRRDLLGGA
jgi:hypothetical protein